jgi:hypothetical protein
MVHWAGEGSDVIICLARDPPRLVSAAMNQPSSVFISYDYGNSFENKTENFLLKGKGYASLENFFIHPKYNSHVSKFYVMMMMMYGSCYIVESDIFVLPVSFRTYSVRLSVHAVGDMIAILSLGQLGSFISICDLFMCRVRVVVFVKCIQLNKE